MLIKEGYMEPTDTTVANVRYLSEELPQYKIGEAFYQSEAEPDPEILSWIIRKDEFYYEWQRDTHELVVFLTYLSPEQEQHLDRAALEIAIGREAGLLIFLFRFIPEANIEPTPVTDWNYYPVLWGSQLPDRRPEPDDPTNSLHRLRICRVTAAPIRTLESIRYVRVPDNVSHAIIEITKDQSRECLEIDELYVNRGQVASPKSAFESATNADKRYAHREHLLRQANLTTEQLLAQALARGVADPVPDEQRE
jgi:hypothetical protein